MIKTIFWKNDAVIMIDQRRLPLSEEFLTCHDYHEVIAAIKALAVRGAPAIDVAAALGIALAVRQRSFIDRNDLHNYFMCICEEFAQARPTAVNLFWAISKMQNAFAELSASYNNGKTGQDGAHPAMSTSSSLSTRDLARIKKRAVNAAENS